MLSCEGRWRWRRVLASTAAAGLALIAVSCSSDDPAENAAKSSVSADGPLRFPEGFTSILSPAPGERMFVVLPTCVEDRDAQVTVDGLDPVTTEGPANTEFSLTWPTPGDPNTWGAGRVSSLPERFELFGGRPATGSVPPCGGPEGSDLEIAVVFGPATDREDVLVDGLEVTYSVDGTTYTETADIRFGVCAPAAADPIEECADATRRRAGRSSVKPG